MARKDRTGNRKSREQRPPVKIPELGYYLVVTDTEAKMRAMIDKCLAMTAYDAQYRIPWIVFDRDEVKDFDEIIREAESFGIRVGWSNPCFEIWMHSYYGSMPAIMESRVCYSEFEKVFEKYTGQRYSKSDSEVYEKIFRTGDEEKALQIARQKHEQCVRDGKNAPSQMCPCTTVYQLVEEIRGKVILL